MYGHYKHLGAEERGENYYVKITAISTQQKGRAKNGAAKVSLFDYFRCAGCGGGA